ncbi:uncharacterized protein LOC119733059 [Patiria miniata]|uniref:Reverse transcriptase domain-containing protein n=1 Tax=Patiria miniata TaxID=46514 RepID=A0A914AGC7_PATMI|nr:uncharacterized protein LOC119733059 [Patiria miniata]
MAISEGLEAYVFHNLSPHADDIALQADQIREAQELLGRLGLESEKVGLHLNAKKKEHDALGTHGGTSLKLVDDIKYLGARMQSTEKDIKVRKALAWKALLDLKKIWTSSLPKKLKLWYFQAAIETILLYGSETWILTAAQAKSLNGCYTRILRIAQNVNWKAHMTNTELYGNLPKISEKVESKRAGHCYRHQELPASRGSYGSQLKHGKPSRGRPIKTIVRLMMDDAGVETTDELASCMNSRDVWGVRHRDCLKHPLGSMSE